MNVLVTGVTGFLGQYLAEHLLDANDQVMGLSRRGVWHQQCSSQLSSTNLLAWDVTEPISKQVQAAVTRFQPDWIVHLAAISAPGQCGSDQPNALAEQTNVAGTQGLLQLASSLPNLQRFLFVSSCHIYAPVQRDAPIVTEESPIGPINGYGITKLRAEQAVMQAGREHGMDVIVARGFQHTGPRQPPRFMLPEWASQLAGGTATIEVKCLQSLIDFSDARDVVRAYRLLLERGIGGQIYNVGSGVARLSGQILTELQNIHARLNPRMEQEAIVELSNKPQTNPIANIEKLRRDTGWQPEISWQQTLTDTMRYWLNHDQDSD